MRNRDIVKLLQCKYVLQEIKSLEADIAKEDWSMVGAIRYTGMPRGGGRHGLDDAYEHIERLREMRTAKIREYTQLVEECEEILSRIKELPHRVLARSLYIDHLPIWRAAQIAHMSESTVKRLKAEFEKIEHF